jgi:hypothetical protein
MATPTGALSNYTNAVQAVRDFESTHDEVFKQHRDLGIRVVDARSALDDAAVESGESFDNGLFKVTVTPQKMTTYDEGRILGKLGISREMAIDAGLIKDVDRPARVNVSEIRK